MHQFVETANRIIIAILFNMPVDFNEKANPIIYWPKHQWAILYTIQASCYFSYIHYNDVIMGPITSQITSLTIVYSTVYSDVDQRKHQSSASLAFVRGIHRGPVNSPHKWPVTRKMFPFVDVIMIFKCINYPKHIGKLHFITMLTEILNH